VFILLVAAQLSFAIDEAPACPDYVTAPEGLIALEEFASRGALSEAEKACLEDSYGRADSLTAKDKISRVLMVNGYAYSTSYWAGLVVRHLEEVDRSDPDIAYLYAHHLFNTDPANAEQAIAWAGVGLERKDAWKGAVHVSRVYGLMQLRAVAAVELWRIHEEAVLTGLGDHKGVELRRNNAKTYAREWVDFARASGKTTEYAVAVCVTTTTTEGFCQAVDPPPPEADVVGDE
jgi:hypothetical protein